MVLELKGASLSEGFVEHLFLNARLASKHFRHVSEFCYIFFFLPIFPNPVLSSYSHCQNINVFGDQRDHVQAQSGLDFLFSSAFTWVNPQLPQPAPEHMKNPVFYARKGARQ